MSPVRLECPHATRGFTTSIATSRLTARIGRAAGEPSHAECTSWLQNGQRLAQEPAGCCETSNCWKHCVERSLSTRQSALCMAPPAFQWLYHWGKCRRHMTCDQRAGLSKSQARHANGPARGAQHSFPTSPRLFIVFAPQAPAPLIFDFELPLAVSNFRSRAPR